MAKKLSKSRFKSTVCNQCGLCNKHKPKFCWATLYKNNSKIFINQILPNLIEQNELAAGLVSAETNATTKIVQQVFKKLICSTGVCQGCLVSRKDVMHCINLFKDQAGYVKTLPKSNIKISDLKSNKKQKGKKGKSKKNKQKIKAVVTVMMSDNPAFVEEVQRILEDYNKQQNKIREAFTAS